MQHENVVLMKLPHVHYVMHRKHTADRAGQGWQGRADRAGSGAATCTSTCTCASTSQANTVASFWHIYLSLLAPQKLSAVEEELLPNIPNS